MGLGLELSKLVVSFAFSITRRHLRRRIVPSSQSSQHGRAGLGRSGCSGRSGRRDGSLGGLAWSSFVRCKKMTVDTSQIHRGNKIAGKIITEEYAYTV